MSAVISTWPKSAINVQVQVAITFIRSFLLWNLYASIKYLGRKNNIYFIVVEIFLQQNTGIFHRDSLFAT